MQYSYSLVPAIRATVERTLSPQRIGRYLPAAGGDPNLALRLYFWNIHLCEAFYMPCHFCEIALRNRLHFALTAHFGKEDWHGDNSFISMLPQNLQSELNAVWTRAVRDHNAAANVHHVVSGLSLGFWSNLLSSRYRNLLWKSGVHVALPFAGAATQIQVHQRVERFRIWRNRIFHHNAIFDKAPKAEMQNIDTLLGWCCSETRELVRRETKVSRVINTRPKF